MVSRHTLSADAARTWSRFPTIQIALTLTKKNIPGLLLVLATVVAYGFAIAKVFQTATSGITASPPNPDCGLLALLGSGYVAYLAYKADSHAN